MKKTPLIALTLAAIQFSAYAQKPKANAPKTLAVHVTPLKVSVTAVAVATKFQVYVGGGANISVPETLQSPFGGGGMPAISMSQGATFLAGEVESRDAKTKLIKLQLAIDNPTEQTRTFKIGDLSLLLSGARFDDFLAVGYNDSLCAMSDADRRIVKQIVVEVPPKAQRTVSYIFPLLDPDAKQGAVVLQHSPPMTFQINAASSISVAGYSKKPGSNSTPTKQFGTSVESRRSQESEENQPISAPIAPAASLEAETKRIDAASTFYEPKGYRSAWIVATREADENAIIGILNGGDYFKATATNWRRLSAKEVSKIPKDIKKDLRMIPVNSLVWLVNVDSLRDPSFDTEYPSLLNNARRALFGALPGSVIVTYYPSHTPPGELKTNGNLDPSKLAYASLNYSILSGAQRPSFVNFPATVASARRESGDVAPAGGSSYPPALKQPKVIQASAKSSKPAPHAMLPARGYVWLDHGATKIGTVAGKGQLAAAQVFGFDEKQKKAGEVGGMVMTLQDTPVALVIYSMDFTLPSARMCGRYSDLILDFSATKGSIKSFPIRVVDSTDGGKELSIITLNVASLTELFISPDYVVFPRQQRDVQQNSPFALVDFAPGKAGGGGAGASTLILTRNGAEIARKKLGDGADLAIALERVQTSNDVLEWQIENAAGKITQSGSLGFPMSGATPDVVRYDVALGGTPR